LNLVIVADSAPEDVLGELRQYGESVELREADLSSTAGAEAVYAALQGRNVDALLADVIDSNITGSIELVQRVARDMVAEGVGRILITGSIACIESFASALRNELQDSGVTVTFLRPTDTDFPAHAWMSAAEVARVGYEAMSRCGFLAIPGNDHGV
jgi:uncharacterized protein